MPVAIALHLHVVPGSHGAFVAAELAGANRAVGYEIVSTDDLPADFAHVVTPADRDAIANGRRARTGIDVFVVDQLDDIDEPGRIYGVTWHRYVIVSAEALERTLAHELGHVFGLHHSSYDSIMNPDLPPSSDRMFAPEELAILRRRVSTR